MITPIIQLVLTIVNSFMMILKNNFKFIVVVTMLSILSYYIYVQEELIQEQTVTIANLEIAVDISQLDSRSLKKVLMEQNAQILKNQPDTALALHKFRDAVEQIREDNSSIVQDELEMLTDGTAAPTELDEIRQWMIRHGKSL